MDNYEIANDVELGKFFADAFVLEQGVEPVKGEPPQDAVYSDGDSVANPINVAWRNKVTGEQIDIIYRLRQQSQEQSK